MPENILDAFKAQEREWAKQELERSKQETKSAADFEQKVMEIASLITQPGWKHLMADLHKFSRAAYATALGENSDRKAALALGATHAYLTIEQWAAANLEVARSQQQTPTK